MNKPQMKKAETPGEQSNAGVDVEKAKTSSDTTEALQVSQRDQTPQLPAANAGLQRRSRVKRADSGVIEVLSSESLTDMLANIRARTGVGRDEVAIRLVQQVGRSLHPTPNSSDEAVGQAIATLAELGPQNATEAMLATQMIATHNAALRCMAEAMHCNQTVDGVDRNVLRATRLMRLFNEQLEAMQKLKGKTGQQKVTVEHVHVHEGGQAIVGAVSAGEWDRGGGQQP